MDCPYRVPVNYPEMKLCMLYSQFTIDGQHWANYPNCNKENCPFLHPELIGNKVWESNN